LSTTCPENCCQDLREVENALYHLYLLAVSNLFYLLPFAEFFPLLEFDFLHRQDKTSLALV